MTTETTTILKSQWLPDKSEVVAERALVVAKHPLAVQAGIDILRAGGNAIDAAVAMGFVMIVVKPAMVCLGGIGFMVIHQANGEPLVVEGPPRAPLAARPDMYEIEGVDTRGIGLYRTKGEANDRGHTAVAVPGNVALLTAAHARLGRLPLAAVMESAIGIAHDGFVVDWLFTTYVGDAMSRLRENAGAAAVLLPDGCPPRYGDGAAPFRQRDLAQTLRLIARDGAAGFYQGEVAEAIEQDFRAHGGLITREDLARYEATITAPLRGRYRGHEVLIPAMPCGATTALETLHLLDRFDLGSLDHNSAEELHLFIECARRAFADRFHYLGDPEVVSVPLAGLFSDGYADEIARSIDRERASATPPQEPWAHYSQQAPAGDPWRWDGQPRPTNGHRPDPALDDSSCTTHLAAVDADRNAVTCTITAGSMFGAKVLTPGTGVLWNNGMSWFDARPGSANAIAPGKLAVTNMTPLIVRRDGRPVLLAGSPGGRKIINAVTRVVSNVLDHGLGAQAAVTAPRVDASANTVAADARLDPAVVEELRARGHQVNVVEESPVGSAFSRPLAITIDEQDRLHSGLSPFHITEARGY